MYREPGIIFFAPPGRCRNTEKHDQFPGGDEDDSPVGVEIVVTRPARTGFGNE